MKRTLISIAIAATAMLGTSALAEEATYVDGVVSYPASGVKTVLVTDSVDDIWYINQAEFGSALDATAGFALKTEAPAGAYTLSLGYNDVGETGKAMEEVTFEIVEALADLPVAVLTGEGAIVDNGDGTHNSAFKAENVVLTGYKSLVFTFVDGENSINMAYPLSALDIPTISGDGAITLAIQLNNIPEQYKGNVSLCFSAYEVEGGIE